MEWITENWLWLVLGGGMVAMHMFGHRGHGAGHGGGHGGGCCGGGGARRKSEDDGGADQAASPGRIGVE